MKLGEYFSKERRRRNRFKIVNGYKFDKRIFQVFAAVVFFSTLAYIAVYGFEKNVYVTCPESASYCENPLYFDPIKGNPYMDYCADDICEQEFLPAGFEYGKKPTLLYSILGLGWAALLMLGFALNHLIHNRPRGVKVADNRKWSE